MTCDTLDENGRPLPQPNISFICGQVMALRQDCEMSARQGARPILLGHCFGFSPRDVSATGSADPTRSQVKSSGGGR